MKKRVLILLLLISFLMVSVFLYSQQDGGTLVYGEYGSPIRLVPILANDSISTRLIELIYGSLVYYDPDGNI